MSASIAPGWAETSVRWLRSHHPEYVSATSKRTFYEQLASALGRMSYGHLEPDGTSGLPKVVLEMHTAAEVRDFWAQSAHLKMVDWLNAGGYKGMLARAEAEAAVKESRGVRVFTPDGEETIELEMDDSGEESRDGEEWADRDPVGAAMDDAISRARQEAELDEVVAADFLAQDARLGAW